MNEYQKYEQTCREHFTAWAKTQPTIYDIEYETNDYCSTDATYYSGFTKTKVELKKRKHLHTKKWEGRPDGFIFEKTKYDDLMLATDCPDKTFITIFLDKVVIWNIGVMNLEFKPDLLSKNTANNPKNEKKLKDVVYLTIEQASHIINIT